MTLAVSDGWIEGPLKQFVSEARVQLAVVLHTSGQALGQYGFSRSVEVMSACALSAAIHASSGELGRMLDGSPFRGLHYAGQDRQVFLGQLATGERPLLLLAVFGDESSLGLVQLYLREFSVNLAAAMPAEPDEPPALGDDFERELNHNLAVLFGRA